MTSVTNLSTLRDRITRQLDDEETIRLIEEEFDKFRVEVEFMSSSEDGLGQAKLTDQEIRRLSVGNQHSDDLSIVEWQCVKAAAIYYNVPDWTSKVDSSLSYTENIGRMESYGTADMERAREAEYLRRSRQES